VNGQIRVRSFDELAEQYVAERTDSDRAPARLGFGSLDARMRGVSPGQVCVFAGRTAVGKTFALCSVLHSFTARTDAGCLVLSLEQPGPEWFERQLAIHADVAHETVEQWARQGELGRHLVDFLERMRHVRLVEDSVRLEDLLATLERAQAELRVPLRMVLIDQNGCRLPFARRHCRRSLSETSVGKPGRSLHSSLCTLGLVVEHREHEVGNAPTIVADTLAHVPGEPLRSATRVPRDILPERPPNRQGCCFAAVFSTGHCTHMFANVSGGLPDSQPGRC
jgi:hypothetical protein